MKYKTFEDYLKNKFTEENPEILDDDMPDKYECWLHYELLVEDFIKYADEYAIQQKQEIVEGVEKEIRLRKIWFGSEMDFENYIACIKQVINK